MPAKGSCCCVPQFGAATMWKVNVFTGEVVDAMDYDVVTGLQSGMIAIDSTHRVELGASTGTGANCRYWNTSGALQWGPLARTTDNFRGWAYLLDDYVVYGGGGELNSNTDSYMGTGGALSVLLRSDGSQVSHSMAGKLVHAQDDYIDAFDPSTDTLRRYEASDLTTVRTSVTCTGMSPTADLGSCAFSTASYALLGATILRVVEPSDLSVRFDVNPLPSGATKVVEDGEGGVYLYTGGANDQILKYSSSSTPDWDVTDTSYLNPRRGTGGHIYFVSGSNVSKINGADGSIDWTFDVSPYAADPGTAGAPTAGFNLCLAHSGILLWMNVGAVVAIDVEYGTLEWWSPYRGWGRPVTDGSNYVWLCGSYGV